METYLEKLVRNLCDGDRKDPARAYITVEALTDFINEEALQQEEVKHG